MTFTVGETVVYPHHGAATVEEISSRTFKGETREYLKLRVNRTDLTIEVPAANAERVGMRDVIDAEGLDRVFDVLREPFVEEPTNWSRRQKANSEKLGTGDIMKLAEVVRDLWRRNQEKVLSASEKRMLTEARQVLVSEVALAEKIDDDRADALLSDVLAS